MSRVMRHKRSLAEILPSFDAVTDDVFPQPLSDSFPVEFLLWNICALGARQLSSFAYGSLSVAKLCESDLIILGDIFAEVVE